MKEVLFSYIPFIWRLRYLSIHNFKPGISSIKQTIDYVVRYAGRHAMALSRILNHNGKYFTFWYDRHEDGKRVEETIHVYEFIKRLIKHIPDKNFKIVRYYSLYAREHKHSSKIFKLLMKRR